MPNTTSSITSRVAYDQAVATAKAWADAYYNSGTLLADDDEYDALLAAIAQAERSHGWSSDLNAVAGGVGNGDVLHRRRMLSLDNAMSREELELWLGRMTELSAELVVEPKLDGLAIVATYRAGALTQIATRGDGTKGEDVTAQAANITGLPATLTQPIDCEVRGECYLDMVGFDGANQERISRGKPEFVNARNAVAGMVRTKTEPYSTRLCFAAYDFDDGGGRGSYRADMGAAKDLGFSVAQDLLPDMDEPEELVAWVQTNRTALGYDVDGCVLKVDQRQLQSQLGESSRAPRWAIAYKFPAETRRTRLTGISVEVGRSGVLTFTAELEPVFVGQATVRAATLHNVEDMRRRIGVDGVIHTNVDVFVRRAGDVIPEIVALAGPLGADASIWEPPSTCPRCQGILTQTGPRLHCQKGRGCGVAEWINYAVSRDCLDIEGLGDTLVAALVADGAITTLSDLYRLDRQKLLSMPRIGAKKADQILSQIEMARTQPLSRQLAALGVAATGRRISARLAAKFNTMDALIAATVDDLATVDGVGAKKALIIAGGLAEMKEEIASLEELGVNLTHQSESVDSQGPFAGKSVCVTGSIPGLSRDEAQAVVAAAGGRAASGVSAKLDILVAGERAGSKLRKAESLGVTTIDAEEFLKLVAAYL